MIKYLIKNIIYHSKYYISKRLLVYTYPLVKFDKYRRIKKYHRPVFESRKAMFIHVPKAAGTSIIKAFTQGDVCKGMSDPFRGYTAPAQYYKHFFGDQFFNSVYKFAFVRNPWDRLLSAYSYLERMNWLKYLGKTGSFKNFVKNWITKKRLYKDVHLIPQHYFICDSNGKLLVDYLGRFETLNDDIQAISNQINFNIDIKHFNKSTHDNYRNIYDEEMKTIVETLYEEDIHLFNYKF